MFRFIELGGVGGLEADFKRQENIAKLRENVRAKDVHTEEYNVEWTDKGIQEDTHMTYIEELGQKMYDTITDGVAKAVQKQAEEVNLKI